MCSIALYMSFMFWRMYTKLIPLMWLYFQFKSGTFRSYSSEVERVQHSIVIGCKNNDARRLTKKKQFCFLKCVNHIF